jgi:rhodanese-related sulfurtransferase
VIRFPGNLFNLPEIFMLRRAVVALLVSSFSFVAMAEDPVTPTALKGGKVITVDEAAALSKAKSAVFVDTRSPLNYGKGHIPAAVSAAYKEKSDKVENFKASDDSFDFAKIPADKAAAVVFYSDGPTGWKSYKAAVLAIKEGYKNVSYFRGGYADWTAKNLPSDR